MVGDPLRRTRRRVERLEIVAVGHALDVPAVTLEPFRRVVREGEVGVPFDGDVILVVEPDQLAELQVARERTRLVRNPLHQVAVGRDEIREMIDDVVAGAVEERRELRFGDRHADHVARALTERSRRRFHARRVPELRMPGSLASPLAEPADVVEREVVPGEKQRRVQQHAGMAAGEHEAIAVGPGGVRRIVAQVPRPQNVGERREGHRCARMPGVGLLHRIHGQRADGVDAQLVEIGARRGGDVRHACLPGIGGV